MTPKPPFTMHLIGGKRQIVHKETLSEAVLAAAKTPMLVVDAEHRFWRPNGDLCEGTPDLPR